MGHSDDHRRPDATARAPSDPHGGGDLLDALVIGAGFHGLYQLFRLRQHGFRVLLVDAEDRPGGVWASNRYPGARVDSHVPNYEFSLETLWRDWNWTERFPAQPELERYFRYVVARLDLAPDIRFNTRISGAAFDEQARCWDVHGERGERFRARFLLPCLGFATHPYVPDLPGLETFQGPCHHTARWPRAGISFNDQSIGVIGTGASGVQVIQEAAPVASRLTVFQRTPMLALPMQQEALTPAMQTAAKHHYAEDFRRRNSNQSSYHDVVADRRPTYGVDAAERLAVFEQAWQAGGFQFWAGTFSDVLAHPVSNRLAYDFWRDKTRARIHDSALADKLAPLEPPHPFGAKRPSLEQGYYELFNQANVQLVDVREDPIVAIEPDGVRTQSGLHRLDALVLATGFDAGTGGFTQLGLANTQGLSLTEYWAEGVRTHLGIAVPGFPNVLMLYGPQSPAAFCNGPTCAELQGDWIIELLLHLRAGRIERIEATEEAAEEWRAHMQVVTDRSLMKEANSWYMGANIPGKTRELLFHPGAQEYLAYCRRSAAAGYAGFRLG